MISDFIFSSAKETMGLDEFDALPEENTTLTQEQSGKFMTSFQKQWYSESHVGMRVQ
jgi:hypothetical protein